MRMQAKGKELIPGTEEPSIRIATPLSRLQVSFIQEALRETGWKYSDKFFGNTTSSGVRPTYKMVIYQAKIGLKRAEVLEKLQGAVGTVKLEQR